MMELTTRLSDLTLGDLIAVIDERRESEFVSGINGLAEYLQCSSRTAQSIKSSGKIDEATIQVGRTILFEKRKLKELLRAK